jgi:hypothetical protein
MKILLINVNYFNREKTEMEEIYTFIGSCKQTTCDVYIFFHNQKHEEILDNLVDHSSAEIYNAMLNEDSINKDDVILIYSNRFDNDIRTILVTHVTSSLPIFDNDGLLDLLKKCLSANRSADTSLYVQKLTFTDDKLLKCESYHIETDISNVNKSLLLMSNAVDKMHILKPIEFRSLKNI